MIGFWISYNFNFFINSRLFELFIIEITSVLFRSSHLKSLINLVLKVLLDL